MKIQTTNLDKGGGGKSSHTYNEGDWLSRVKNKRTLLIDGARECNLTHSFDVTSEKTIYDIFTTGEYENDESLVTANFIAVSDIVLGVTDASTNGFRAWLALKKFVDYIKSEAVEVITKKSYVKADAYLIGNKIEYYGNNVTDTCKQFLDVVQEDEAYLGSIQKKELVAKSLVINQSVFEQREQMTAKQKQDHQKFYDNIEYVYENILTVLEREVA